MVSLVLKFLYIRLMKMRLMVFVAQKGTIKKLCIEYGW